MISKSCFAKSGKISAELRFKRQGRGNEFTTEMRETDSLCSYVNEIGSVIEMHMKRIGMITDEPLSEHTKRILEKKRLEFENRINVSMDDYENSFPDGAELCNVSSTRAMVYLDGCMTCLNCGESKCS